MEVASHRLTVGLAGTGKGAVEEVEANVPPVLHACRGMCGPGCGRKDEGDNRQATPKPVRTLVLACQPLCTADYDGDLEVLPMASGVEEARQERLHVSWDWPRALEALKSGALRFEELQSWMHELTESAMVDLEDRQSALAQLVADTHEVFKTTLKQVNDSGNSLLSAAGDMQRNRNIVFKMVPTTSRSSRQAAEELMLCRTSVLAAATANGEVLQSTQLRLRHAHQSVGRALRGSHCALQRATELLRWEGELNQLGRNRGWLFVAQAESLFLRYRKMLEAIMKGGASLQTTAHQLVDSRKAFRRAIVVNRSVIRQADMSLQNDQEVVFNWALGMVSDGRKGDRSFVMTVVEANGEALEQVPKEFQGDREIVQIAVEQSEGWALQFAAEPLKRDRDIVLAAVSRSGFALEHVADELKRDRVVVLAAVEANGEALEFASEDLRDDREVVLAAVRSSGGMALSVAGPSLRGDREIALACVSRNALTLEHICPELRGDRDLVMVAVQANGLALEHAAEPLRGDRDVVLAALRSNALAMRFASDELRACREVAVEAVSRDGYALEHVSEDLRRDRGLVEAAVREGGAGVLELAAPALREEEELLAVAEKVSIEKRKIAEDPLTNSSLWQSGGDPECVRL